MSRQRRRGPLVARALILVSTVIVAAACRQPRPPGGTTTTRPAGGGHAPVVFVHGWGLSGPLQWPGVMNQFRAAGYANGELAAITYDYTVHIEQSSQVLAREVAAVLARTGAPRVDIVSHSMGSMVAKHCILVGGCKGRTGHWESISGVDNGANQLALATGMDSDDDVQGRTGLRKELQDAWPVIAADGVKVQVHWSRNDGLIVPGSLSKQPPPATDIEKPALNHITTYSNRAVIAETISFFAT